MSTRMARFCTYTLGLMTMLVAIPSGLLAGSLPAAPEIDPASISAAVGLVAAGVLILRSRRGSK
jgi:hypothetical protein